MIEEIRRIKSGKKQLRQFGIALAIVLAFWGTLCLWRQKDYCPYLFTLSALFLVLGSITPILLKPVQKTWMSLAALVGWLITRIILLLLFYLIVTPIGVLRRMLRKRFLELKLDKDLSSYWIAREDMQADKQAWENQF